MASQPKWHAFCARLDALGGMDYICERIANGETLLGVTRDLQTSRYTMWRYITLTDERKKQYEEARRLGAAALAEDAVQIADDADVMSPAGVSAAKLQVDTRKWLAGVQDRAGFGEQPKSAGVLVMGDLHLTALQKHGAPEAQAALPAPKPSADIVEAEIIEESDGQATG
jgi:hypothetical protein